MREIERRISQLSNAGYWLVCSTLFLFAIGIVIFAIVSMLLDFFQEGFNVYGFLDEVGLMIFAVAVIDVCKYLVVEEILKKGKEREGEQNQSQKAFIKFGTIIATALSLEGLVLTIETAQQNLNDLLYPLCLLLIAIFYIIGIGIYYRLNNASE